LVTVNNPILATIKSEDDCMSEAFNTLPNDPISNDGTMNEAALATDTADMNNIVDGSIVTDEILAIVKVEDDCMSEAFDTLPNDPICNDVTTNEAALATDTTDMNNMDNIVDGSIVTDEAMILPLVTSGDNVANLDGSNIAVEGVPLSLTDHHSQN
jgi:hypothetical protein